MGKFTVFLEFLYAEVYSSICCRISVAFINEDLDHVDHSLDLLCSLRCCCGRFYIHICHIFFALFNVTCGDLFCRNAFLDGFLDDLVIYICKVGYIVYFISFIFHISSYRIKNDHRTGISNMDQIIYSRSADIHLYLALFQRYEFLFSPCQCVKNLHVTLPPISRFYTGSRSPEKKSPLPVL